MNATAYWVTGAAGAHGVTTTRDLEQALRLAIPSGAARIDITRTGKLSAAVIATGGSDRVAIEWYAGDRRSVLSLDRRTR